MGRRAISTPTIVGRISASRRPPRNHRDAGSSAATGRPVTGIRTTAVPTSVSRKKRCSRLEVGVACGPPLLHSETTDGVLKFLLLPLQLLEAWLRFCEHTRPDELSRHCASDGRNTPV